MNLTHILVAFLVLAGMSGCRPFAERASAAKEEASSIVLKPDRNPPPQAPTKEDSTAALIAHLKGPAPDRAGRAQTRAMAIDLLAARQAREAIPSLIECLSDGRALTGSDNWVGGHAANALSTITGRPFSVDQKAWRAWWRLQGQDVPH